MQGQANLILTVKSMNVRCANPDDVSLIFLFIQKKAKFDREIGAFSGTLRVSEEKIRKTLFGEVPFSYVLFAELSGREIGFALYGFRYSSFLGEPSIWLDDLYVDEDSRGWGAGTALMAHLAHISVEHGCSHVAWTADVRNTRGLNFYRRLGAEVIEQQGNRCFLKWLSS